MLPSGKWIEGLDSEGSVADAARSSLEVRLMAVIQALPLAAYLAERDVEHVHRLRVSTRRAMAALELYRDWLPRKPARWLRRNLKKLRRAAGSARDLDVLAARLEHDYGDRAAAVVQLVRQKRQAAQPAIVRAAERCRHEDRFVTKTLRLLENNRTKKESAQEATLFRDWAEDELQHCAKAFFMDTPCNSEDTTALHQFRIRAKELRYTIELLVSAVDATVRKKYYPVVESLQERLGAVQDHSAAIEQLNEWAEEADHDETQELLQELAEQERERLLDAVASFKSWWTDERENALKAGLLGRPESSAKNASHAG